MFLTSGATGSSILVGFVCGRADDDDDEEEVGRGTVIVSSVLGGRGATSKSRKEGRP